MEKNQFRLADVILSVICVVFVAEAAAPVASIGNSQYFWWIFMILAFLLPYGLIAAELGTAYAGDGGLYDWIHAAYPNGKWAARASWYYWINFPLWMASLAVMCPELITFITGRSLGTFGSLVVELLFIWIVTLIACYPVCDSIIILNVSAVIKIVLALLVGGLGVWHISRYGFVNDMSARTFLPSFDLNSLSYISVIIFNFLGFEVVCTYANNMSDPKKQIPQSIVTGGIVIADIGPGEREMLFSQNLACPECGISMEELAPRSFSFNSPFGACPTCAGLGVLQKIDPDLIVPD